MHWAAGAHVAPLRYDKLDEHPVLLDGCFWLLWGFMELALRAVIFCGRSILFLVCFQVPRELAELAFRVPIFLQALRLVSGSPLDAAGVGEACVFGI